MKRRDLERKLLELGWKLLRHGGAHDLWTNGGARLAIPRHREIAGSLARKLLRSAAESEGRNNEV